MDTYDMVVAERLQAAELLGTLTAGHLRQQSLCTGWTVRDVAAHLISYLRFGKAKLYLGIVTMAADFDRLNVQLTRREARRPTPEIVELLRRRAGSQFTVPRSGYDPVLADLVLHDLDVRLPLGIPRTIPEERLWVTFHHLTARPAPGFTMGTRLTGLQVTAEDTGWTYGSGAPIRGCAETLTLGIGGRVAALNELSGDGVPLLRERLTNPPPRLGPLRRLAVPLGVLLHPPVRDRRSSAT